MSAAWRPLGAWVALTVGVAVGVWILTPTGGEAVIRFRQAWVRLTGISEGAWQVGWYEPRVRRYTIPRYDPYPEMPPIDRLGFVYRLLPSRHHRVSGETDAP